MCRSCVSPVVLCKNKKEDPGREKLEVFSCHSSANGLGLCGILLNVTHCAGLRLNVASDAEMGFS